MSKVLVDTNIFIYALDKSSSYHLAANKILSNESLELYTTSKNISEYFAVCSKLKVDIQKMVGFYEDMKNNIQIIYLSAGSLVHFEKPVEKYAPKGNRVFDVEIVSIMLHHDIKLISTFNGKDFIAISEVKIWV